MLISQRSSISHSCDSIFLLPFSSNFQSHLHSLCSLCLFTPKLASAWHHLQTFLLQRPLPGQMVNFQYYLCFIHRADHSFSLSSKFPSNSPKAGQSLPCMPLSFYLIFQNIAITHNSPPGLFIFSFI